MKLCPSGHPNTDDARRCAVCLRRLSAAPPRLELTGLPAGPVVVEAGAARTVTVGLALHGGGPTPVRLELGGGAAGWAEVWPASLVLDPEVVREVALGLHVPAGAPSGGSVLALVARGGEDGRPEARAEVLLDVRTVAPAVEPPPPPSTPDPEADTPTMVRPALGVPEPGPVGPVAPEPRPAPPGRRRAAVLVLLGAAAVVAVVLVGLGLAQRAGDDGEAATGSLTAEQAYALPADEAHAVLDELRSADAGRVGELLAEPGVLVQLSSKCASQEEADLVGDDGVGVPDGSSESYPDGVGDNGILAFHVAAHERFGDTVLLTDGDALSRKPCPEGGPAWLTVMTPDDGLPAEVGDALCVCKSLGLPFGECGAAPTDGSKPVYWTRKNQHKACP